MKSNQVNPTYEVIQVRIPNKPWTTGITFGPSSSAPHGSCSTSVGIVSIDQSTASSSEPKLQVGDEVVAIDGVVLVNGDKDIDGGNHDNDSTRSTELAAKNLLKNAQGPAITIILIRFGLADYLPNLVRRKFQTHYNVNWIGSARAVLEPKDNPNGISSILFPLLKKRFRYELIFKDGSVTHQDLLKLKTVPTTVEMDDQLVRIQRDWKRFAEQVQEVELEMEMDRSEYHYVRNEAVAFTTNVSPIISVCIPVESPGANAKSLSLEPLNLSKDESVDTGPANAESASFLPWKINDNEFAGNTSVNVESVSFSLLNLDTDHIIAAQ